MSDTDPPLGTPLTLLLALHPRTLPLTTHTHAQKKIRCRAVDFVRTCVENVNVKWRRKHPKHLQRDVNARFVTGAFAAMPASSNGMMTPGMMAPGMMGFGMPMTMPGPGSGVGYGIRPQAGAVTNHFGSTGEPLHRGMVNPHGLMRGVGSSPRLSSATSASPPTSEFDDCTRDLVALQASAPPPTEGSEVPSTAFSESVTMQLGTHCTEKAAVPVTSKWLWMMGFDRIIDMQASSDGAAASFDPICPELGNTRTWEPQAGILSSTKSPYGIVAANNAWLTQCNVTLEGCAGRTCSILHGEETEKDRAGLLMAWRGVGIAERPHVISVSLTNYTLHDRRRKFNNECSIWEVERSDSVKKEHYFLTLCNMVFPPHAAASGAQGSRSAASAPAVASESSSEATATATEGIVSSVMPPSTVATATVSALAADAAPAPAPAPALAPAPAPAPALRLPGSPGAVLLKL